MPIKDILPAVNSYEVMLRSVQTALRAAAESGATVVLIDTECTCSKPTPPITMTDLATSARALQEANLVTSLMPHTGEVPSLPATPSIFGMQVIENPLLNPGEMMMVGNKQVIIAKGDQLFGPVGTDCIQPASNEKGGSPAMKAPFDGKTIQEATARILMQCSAMDNLFRLLMLGQVCHLSLEYDGIGGVSTSVAVCGGGHRLQRSFTRTVYSHATLEERRALLLETLEETDAWVATVFPPEETTPGG